MSVCSEPFLSALQNMGVEFLHGVENFHQGEVLFVQVAYNFLHAAKMHQCCNPLQGHYRVELLHREIPVVIAGNGVAEYNFFQFGLHSFPVFLDYRVYPVIFTGSLQGRIYFTGRSL